MNSSSDQSRQKPFTDHEEEAVNNQGVEHQAMGRKVYVLFSHSLDNKFNPITCWPKAGLNEIQCDWNLDAPRQTGHANPAIFGIYVTCAAEAQDKGYRLIKRDCKTAQAYGDLDHVCDCILEELGVPLTIQNVFSITEMDYVKSDIDHRVDCKDWVCVDVLESLAPFVADCIASQVYELFEFLYAQLQTACGYSREDLNAALSVTICLPPNTPIEAIKLLRSYFHAG